MTCGSVTSFSEQGPHIRDFETRKRLIEGIVASDTDSRDATGTKRSFVDSDFQYQGAVTTQQMIQDELIEGELFPGCSPSLAKKLQLMQTAPPDRVKNTLHIFAKHPSLLQNPDMSRLFTLNLFRAGHLSQALKNPQFYGDCEVHLCALIEAALNGEAPLPIIAQTVARVMALFPEEEMTILQDLNSTLMETLDAELTLYEEKLLSGRVVTASVEVQQMYRAWLLAKSEMTAKHYDPEERKLFASRILFFATLPRHNAHEDGFAQIFECYDRLLPQLIQDLQEDPEGFAKVTRLRIRNTEETSWSADGQSKGILWTNGKEVFNLQTGEISFSRSFSMPLPAAVKMRIGNLLPEDALRRQYTFTSHNINGEPYNLFKVQGTMNGEEKQLKIFKHASDPERVEILLEMEEGEWFQLQDSPFSKKGKETLPRSLQAQQCWTNEKEGTIHFIDKRETLLGTGFYTPETGTINTLTVTIGNTQREVLFPTENTSMESFQRLEDQNGVLFCKGEGQTFDKIHYPNLGLTYTRDPDANPYTQFPKWYSSRHPEYFLSEKTLSAVSQPLIRQGMKHAPEFFKRSFNDYQLLESEKSGNAPILLLSGRRYTPYKTGDETLIRKHTDRQYAQPPVVSDPEMLFTYTIDPERGLCATEPEGYLYLAYTLYTQGKFPQAALAMRQGCNRMQGISKRAREIFDYFEEWENDEPNAHALRAQLAAYKMEQLQMEQVPESDAIMQDREIYPAVAAYKNYLKWESHVDPQLHLSNAMQEQFHFLARRSVKWFRDHIPNIVESLDCEPLETRQFLLDTLDQRKFLELEEALKTHFLDFEDLHFYVTNDLMKVDNRRHFVYDPIPEENEKTLIRWALDKEIAIRTENLPEMQEPNPEELKGLTLDEGVAVITNGTNFLLSEKVSLAEKEKILSVLEEMETFCENTTDPYEAEMTREMIQDTKVYCAKIGLPLEEEIKGAKTVYTGVNRENIKALKEEMERNKEPLENDLQNLQSSIIRLFKVHGSPRSFVEQMQERDPVALDLFRQGRWCFGSNDWSPLLEKGLLKPESIEELSELYKNYLLTSTTLQQTEQVLEAIEEMKTNPVGGEEELKALLQGKRHYALDHPMAHALLLLEEELGIICRKNQVDHFAEMLTHRSSFKHEAWAGGKTSVLRHLITKFHADGGYISGLLTHQPLIEEHHEQLKESTAAFYGQQAFRTDFSREAPVGGVEIRREHLKLLKAVQGKGRTDQTLNSLLSRRHAYNLHLLSLTKEGDPTTLDGYKLDEEKLDTLSAFGDLLTFQQERMIVGSDEIEQLFASDRQNNYSVRAPIHLPKEVTGPPVEILRFLVTDKYAEFIPFFEAEDLHPHDMTEEQYTRFVECLKEDFCTRYALKNIKKQLDIYWSPTASYAETIDIHDAFKERDDAKLLQSVRVFLRDILPPSFEKKEGVHYGVSSDGVHVKPFSDSKCQEKSQLASIHLTSWLSCLSIFRNGIQTKHTKSAVEAYLSSLKENAEKQKNDPGESLDTTEVGTTFFNRFNIQLSEVKVSDYADIANTINEDLELKIEFLEKANFHQTTYHGGRLVGNAKQAAYEFKEAWGSSGNNERMRTLPKKIALHETLSRQKGTMGKIVYNLIKDYKEGDIFTVESKRGIAEILGTKLGKQSAFVDLGPFFEGKSPEQCVDEIQEHDSESAIRYVNSQGLVVIRLPDGSERPGDTSIPKGNCKTLFFHSDRRGRNLLLEKETEHLISLSFDTTWTDFSQGGMRLRDWGNTQSARYVVDHAGSLAMKGNLTPAGLMQLLIKNETAQLKRLHAMSTTQEILAVGDAAVQRMLRQTKDPASLVNLKELCQAANYLDQDAEVDFEQLSRPKEELSPHEHYNNVIAREQKRLENLLKEIKAHPEISDETKGGCTEEITSALRNLDEEKLVLEEKYYPETVSSSTSHDMVENVEVEQELAIQVQVSDTIQVEKEEEQQVHYELDPVELRPPCPFKMEPQMKLQDIDQWEGKYEYIEILGERIYTTDPLGAFYANDPEEEKKFIKGLRVQKSEEEREGKNKTYFPWMRGTAIKWKNPKHQQLFVPSVLLKWNRDSGEVEAMIGSGKDADSRFEQLAEEHGQYVNEKTLYVIHYKFDDLRSIEEILQDLPSDITEAMIQKTAAAKCNYAGDVMLSNQEEKVVKHYQKECAKVGNTGCLATEANMLVYLETHFPEEEHTLYQQIEQIRRSR